MVAGGGVPNNTPALQVGIGEIYSVARDSQGNLLITAPNNNIFWKIDSSGQLTIVVGNGIADFSGDGGPLPSQS